MDNRSILIGSALIGMASVVTLSQLSFHANQVLVGGCMGLAVVCALPWVVQIRRKFFKTPPVTGKRWTRAINSLLVCAVLIGPLTAGSVYMYLWVAYPAGGLTGLRAGLGILLLLFGSFFVGFGLFIVALLVQLWRDQWSRILNTVAIALYFIAFLIMAGM